MEKTNLGKHCLFLHKLVFLDDVTYIHRDTDNNVIALTLSLQNIL